MTNFYRFYKFILQITAQLSIINTFNGFKNISSKGLFTSKSCLLLKIVVIVS